jgi:phage terminase large subunit-like protein
MPGPCGRALIEQCREPSPAAPVRTVVGVDPASAGGTPAASWWWRWARMASPRSGRCHGHARQPRTLGARRGRNGRHWNADRVVAEANQGGAMVESVLRAASIALPLRLVHATRGKARGPSRSPRSMNRPGAIAANLPRWRTSCAA